jgi:phosphoribosylcarboxyaminoimidazole (NCAIR) mutase
VTNTVGSCHPSIKFCHWNYRAEQRVEAVRTPKRIKEEGLEMKKFGFATIAATAFAAALVGLAAPAAATTVAAPVQVGYSTGIDHHQWINDIQQKVNRPPVPIVGNGR